MISMVFLFLACGDAPPKAENKPAPQAKVEPEAKPEAKPEVKPEAKPEKTASTEAATASAEPAHPGKEVYQRVCQQCHQNEGQGIPGLYPPLAGSEWPVKEVSIPIRIVLHGLQGPIKVKGQDYGSMQMAAQGSLSDDEIAKALSYVRSSWGNKAEPVTADQVKAVREQYKDRGAKMWTVEELTAAK